MDRFDFFKYLDISSAAIKNFYVNEEKTEIAKYINLNTTEMDNVAKYMHSKNTLSQSGPSSPANIAAEMGAVVFIETYPEGKIPVEGGKGVRKTWLDGYSPVREFYSPNYTELPSEPNDYRRTLYWNPMVAPDKTGRAKIQFYNNSRTINFTISAESITSQGLIGALYPE